MSSYFEVPGKIIVDLMTTTEFKVAALLALIGILFGFFRRIASSIHHFMTKRSYAAYSSSIAFDQNEVLRSVATYVRQHSMKSDPTARYELIEALSLERQDLLKNVDKFVSEASLAKLRST